MANHYTTLSTLSWCPLENTAYEGYCFNETNSIREKGPGMCEHHSTCAKLRATLDNYADENNNTYRTLERI